MNDSRTGTVHRAGEDVAHRLLRRPERPVGVLRNRANPAGVGFVRAISRTSGYSIVEDQRAEPRSEDALFVRCGFCETKPNRVTARYFPSVRLADY
jgi:hypothetical protein